MAEWLQEWKSNLWLQGARRHPKWLSTEQHRTQWNVEKWRTTGEEVRTDAIDLQEAFSTEKEFLEPESAFLFKALSQLSPENVKWRVWGRNPWDSNCQFESLAPETVESLFSTLEDWNKQLLELPFYKDKPREPSP